MLTPLALSFNLTPKALPTVAALQLQPRQALCYLENGHQPKKKHLQGTDNWGNLKKQNIQVPTRQQSTSSAHNTECVSSHREWSVKDHQISKHYCYMKSSNQNKQKEELKENRDNEAPTTNTLRETKTSAKCYFKKIKWRNIWEHEQCASNLK